MPRNNNGGGLNVEEIIFDMAKDVTELVSQNKMMLHIQQQHAERITRLEKWKSRALGITAGFSTAGGIIGGFLGYMKHNWIDFFGNGGGGL